MTRVDAGDKDDRDLAERIEQIKYAVCTFREDTADFVSWVVDTDIQAATNAMSEIQGFCKFGNKWDNMGYLRRALDAYAERMARRQLGMSE